jgi:kynureninase
MAALAGAAKLFAEAGMGRLRRKSLALTDYLFALLDGRLAGGGFSSPTPREAPRRGGHVALRHAQAERLCRALSDAGTTADFRRPDVLRLTPAPLYNTFEELWTAADTLARLAG